MQKFYEAYQFYGYRESEIGGVLTTANSTVRGDTPLIVDYSEDEMNRETSNTYKEIKEFVKDNNRNIDHQQDILYMQDEVCGSLAAGTHAAAGHLIKVIQWVKK